MNVLGILVAIAGFVSCKVHKFYAEHNVICNICENTVNYVCLGGDLNTYRGCMDDTGKEFTSVCNIIRSNVNTVNSMCNDYSKFDICEKINLCGEWIEDDTDKVQVWNNDIINKINNDKTSTWKASKQKRFKGLTLGDVKRTMLGAVVDPNHSYKLKPDISKPKSNLPASFDARQQWPYCVDIIGHIRDQSACGSCWAFGSTEAFNDRVCITSGQNNTFLQLLSVEDTTACCIGLSCGHSMGCNGGYPTAAWNWFESNGVTSGGDYPDLYKTDTCEPYTLPPCAHHEPSQNYTNCPSKEYATPICVTECINTGYPTSWSDDKHYSEGSYSLPGVTKIMTDISTYGSVSAAFTVYQDFLTYTSGVYIHKTGAVVGGHAIKILGYGTENGLDYWLCANSWNQDWGDNGYFKILKGRNECGIESDVAAGHPKSK